MKYLKMLGLAAVAAMALTAFAASSPAATLEAGGVAQTGSVSLSASLAFGSSAVLSRTDGSLANTCTTSNVSGETEKEFTTKPTGAISTLTFEECTRPVTVHKPGKLYIESAGGTNGTVFSEEAEVTVSTPFGTVNCKTGAGTDIGTLTGVKEGNATMHINAVLNCGFLLPSATWKGAYTMTGANAALGVVGEGGTLGIKFTTTTYQKNQSGKTLSVDNIGTEDWKVVKDSFTSDSGSWSWSGGIQCSPQTVSPGSGCTRTDLACGNATGTVTWTVKVTSLDGTRGVEETITLKCD